MNQHKTVLHVRILDHCFGGGVEIVKNSPRGRNRRRCHRAARLRCCRAGKPEIAAIIGDVVLHHGAVQDGLEHEPHPGGAGTDGDGLGHGSALGLCRSQCPARGFRLLVRGPGTVKRQSRTVKDPLRVLAAHSYPRCAIVANVNDGVAVGQLLDSVAVGRKILTFAERAFICRDLLGHKGQPQHIHRLRWGVESRIRDVSVAVANRFHHRTGADDVVFTAGAQFLRQPAAGHLDPVQRQRMSDVEPGAVHDDAAVDVVLGDPGFMGVVGLENQLAHGHLTHPGIAGHEGILPQNAPDEQRRVPQRSPTAGTGFRVGPGTAEHVAARFRGGTGAVVEDGHDVAGVAAPVWEQLPLGDEVSGAPGASMKPSVIVKPDDFNRLDR